MSTSAPSRERHADAILDALRVSLESLGGIIYVEGPSEDVPIPFTGTDLADHLEILAAQENVSQYLDFLVARIRTFLSDSTMRTITSTDGTTLAKWLEDYVGNDEAEGGCVSVIDLSLVPTDVVHVITAVIARTVFEALQRYMKLTNAVLPTALVIEEAHTFIKRYRDDAENLDAAMVCCQCLNVLRAKDANLDLASFCPLNARPSFPRRCFLSAIRFFSTDLPMTVIRRSYTGLSQTISEDFFVSYPRYPLRWQLCSAGHPNCRYW